MKLLKNNSKLSSNITKKENKALQELSKNEELTILPADKGIVVVILNTEDYKTKATTETPTQSSPKIQLPNMPTN